MNEPEQPDAAAIQRWIDKPYAVLDEAFSQGGQTVWQPGKQLFLADGKVAQAVLANKEGLFDDHSDFFFTGQGIYGPRSAQVDISRGARKLLTHYLEANKDQLNHAIKQTFKGTSQWPDTGNWLMYHHFADALLHPDSPTGLRKLLNAVVKRNVLSGARMSYHQFSRTLFRHRLRLAMYREIKRRRRQPPAEQPRDLLDIVITVTGPDISIGQLNDIYFSFIFATAGSVGFMLGWSVYMLGTHPKIAADPTIKPAWVVRETLRLWPVAWNLARRPAQKQPLADVTVTPQDLVVACPYAVHRNPDNWDDPNSFSPQRWDRRTKPEEKPEQKSAEVKDNTFIPFGYGQHICPAANLSMQLVESILIQLKPYQLTVKVTDSHLLADAALAPPAFSLEVSKTLQSTDAAKQ
ncbi:MAG: hypothetical protein ACI8WB_004515 [Phenylobacterium sp.]|jgi:hypothetical protein